MIRTIPFVAKRPAGDTPWETFEASRSIYERWAPHVCSIACCRSLILARHGSAPSLWRLTQLAIALRVFHDDGVDIRGAFHEPLIDLLASFNIRARLLRRIRGEALYAAVAAGPVMLSIDLAALGYTRGGSHLVLIVDYCVDHFVVHDNAKLLCPAGAACCLSLKRLNAISNARGVGVMEWPTP